MNSGKNFRARRRLEIEAENARQKALTENLEVLKAVKSKELRAIKKLQANIRGYLCRLYVVPKYVAEKEAFDSYNLKEVFNYYTLRQAKLETEKERVYIAARLEYERLKSCFATSLDMTTLRHYVEDSDLQWTRAKITATTEDLQVLYIKRALQQAIDRCKAVNIDFRYLHLEEKKGLDLTSHFVYFSKAITYGNLLIMLRDFKLLSNQSSHGTILQLFQKYAVKVEEEREKVRATFMFRYYNEKYDKYLPAERIAEMIALLGCHHDTTDEAKELLNGETTLSERDFLKFWQKHIGDKLLEIKALREKNFAAEQKMNEEKNNNKKKQKSGGAVPLNKLGLKRAGFEALLLDISAMYFPKNKYCRCRACRNKTLPPRKTPQQVHGKHAMRKALRYHIGPSTYLLGKSGLCGMGTLAGRNILDFKKHLRWWLRFEGNLRSLYVFYATRGWELSPEERKNWDDVTKHNTTLPYSEFVRFTTDFNIYPKYLTNEKYSGFQILHAFLLSCQGNKIDPFHRCRFDSFISVGETSLGRGAMSSKVCSLCGARQIVLSSIEEERLEQEFELYSDEKDNLIFVKDIPEVFEHAREDPLPAQLYFVDKILREVSKVKKKDEDGNEEECINESQFLFAIDQGRRLRYQALSNEITFSEFLHAISILACKAFTFEKLKEGWENPMQEIFKIMDPTFKSKFGHSIETVIQENPERDLMIHTVKSQFKGMLKTLFERYKFLESGLNADEHGMTSDAFQLFVKDCRLVPNIGHVQALNMFKASVKASKVSEGALRMTFDQFFSAINGLMFENFCSSKKKPAPMSYFEPIGPGTGITCAGLAIRNAITKLKILYEDYNPIGRSTGKSTGNIDLGIIKSPESTKTNNNKSGQYLHMIKKGAKVKQKSMAKSRLKRAIRLKSSNLMKLSKLGFGTAMRRDSRQNHVQKLIWDVAEHSDMPDEKKIVVSSDDDRGSGGDSDDGMAGDLYDGYGNPLLMTPSAPPTSKNNRLQDRRRPGRQLKKRKKSKLHKFNNYVNIWRTKPENVRLLIGDKVEKPPALPGIYQSLPTKLHMRMTLNTMEKIKNKNVQTLNWMGRTLNRFDDTRDIIDTSGDEMENFRKPIVGFGHPELMHSVKKKKYHTDDHAVHHFHTAHAHLHTGNHQEASKSLKIGLGIALNKLESAQDIGDILGDDKIDVGVELSNGVITKNSSIDILSANICQLYQALAHVADMTDTHDESEAYRIHQLHFARNATHAERDSLLLLASDSLGLYYSKRDRFADAIKIYKTCLQTGANSGDDVPLHVGDGRSISTVDSRLVDKDSNIDPSLYGRLLINLSEIYKKTDQVDDAIEIMNIFLKLMQKEKDYKQQQIGLKIVGEIYFEENKYTKAIETWKNSLAYCPKASLERCELHLLMAKAYESIKDFSSVALQYAHIVDLHETANSDEDTICNYIKLQADALGKTLLPNNNKIMRTLKDFNGNCFAIIRLYTKYIDIRSVYGGLSNERDICIAYLKIGDIYFANLNEYADAADSYDKAVYTVQNRKGTPLFTKSHLKLGLSLVRLNDDANAEILFKLALSSSLDKESISDQRGLSKYIYNQLGKLKVKKKQYVAAINYFKKYLKIAVMTNDSECEMDGYFHLGMSFLQSFDEGCQDEIEQAISINDIMGDSKFDHNKNGVLEIATSMFNLLRRLSSENKDIRRESQAYVGLAECSTRRSLLTVAIGFYKSAIDLQKVMGDKRGEMEQCGAVGMIYYVSKYYQDAKIYFEKQIEIAKELRDEGAIEQGGIMLARTYKMLYNKALK